MSTFALTIQKISEENFHFTYYKNSMADDIAIERADMVRLLDDATDVLMRKSQKISSEHIKSSNLHKIQILAGDHEIDQ